MIDAPIGLAVAGCCWLLFCVLALAGKLLLRVAPDKLGTWGRALPLPTATLASIGSPPVVGLADAVPLPSVQLGSPAIVRLAKGFVKCSPLFAGISTRLANGFGLNGGSQRLLSDPLGPLKVKGDVESSRLV